MSSNRGRWVHRGDNLDSLKGHEVEVLVVETLIADDLLQEADQLDGIILVWLGKVDVLQVDDQALCFLGSIDTALGVGRLSTHLVELLDHMEGTSLSVTMNCSQGS